VDIFIYPDHSTTLNGGDESPMIATDCYTAGMMRFVVALVFIAIGVWLGLYVIPDLFANMVPSEP
jgi:uncharacterized membrane protein